MDRLTLTSIAGAWGAARPDTIFAFTEVGQRGAIATVDFPESDWSNAQVGVLLGDALAPEEKSAELEALWNEMLLRPNSGVLARSGGRTAYGLDEQPKGVIVLNAGSGFALSRLSNPDDVFALVKTSTIGSYQIPSLEIDSIQDVPRAMDALLRAPYQQYLNAIIEPYKDTEGFSTLEFVNRGPLSYVTLFWREHEKASSLTSIAKGPTHGEQSPTVLTVALITRDVGYTIPLDALAMRMTRYTDSGSSKRTGMPLAVDYACAFAPLPGASPRLPNSWPIARTLPELHGVINRMRQYLLGNPSRNYNEASIAPHVAANRFFAPGKARLTGQQDQAAMRRNNVTSEVRSSMRRKYW